MPKPDGVHALVRRTHEERVLGALREHGAMSRGQLARRVGLSRTTLSEITGSLLRRGAVTVVDTDAAEREGSGRPAERLALDPRSGQYMGVDFGHRRVHVTVADAAHEVVASGTARYGDDDGWGVRLPVAFDLVDRLAADTGVHYGALQGIGIGIPGPVVTRGSAPREGWGRIESGRGVRAAFEQRFSTSVVIDNNTRLAALAEAINAPGGAAQDLLYVRVSDGVGGGLVVGGRLVAGSAGLAGELGHVRAQRGGRPCRCGKDGCLETIASVPAILAECRARGAALSSLEDLREAVARGEAAVEEVVAEAATALGRVVAAAAVTLDPAQVVIAGQVTEIAPALVPQVAATVRTELSTTAESGPTVRAAQLADDGGALGAIAALFHLSPLLAGYATASGAGEATAVSMRSTS